MPSSVLVESDPVLLERILRNIVTNAVRHTDKGRVLVGCRRGSGLRIQVWDTGPGIAADKQEKIFEEFFQLSNPGRDRGLGSWPWFGNCAGALLICLGILCACSPRQARVRCSK